LQEVRFVLKRAIARAPARDKVPIERISRLVGRSSTTTTETIYRKQTRPVIVHGADVVDRMFPGGADHGA
jgi:hypothetical protein